MTNEINESSEIVDDFSTVFHTIFKDRGELIRYRMKFMDIKAIEIFNGILRLVRLNYKFNKIDVDKNDDFLNSQFFRHYDTQLINYLFLLSC